MSAASILRTTQCPAKSLTRGDSCAWIPQARYGVVSRRRPVSRKRCRPWCEEISGRGK